ncbi:glycosyltransferase family 15 protein [[Candida] arabinofermentans NRRL YB-2248]|uniref:Glycosyltransferase family 15 protein n=1 Tax=[Candida] arabinofermentans NRRL YB-2248 TaxID=983967 RepID=A0A1E4SWA6_9ASCO|nr:glycosyltransferase family 15 protein [[Candida] arabinofermentans NRRL YB-2248]
MLFVPKRILRSLIFTIVIIGLLIITLDIFQPQYKIGTTTAISNLFNKAGATTTTDGVDLNEFIQDEYGEVIDPSTPFTWEQLKKRLSFKSPIYNSNAPRDYIVKDSMKSYKQIFEKKITEPKGGMILKYKDLDDSNYELANATLLTMVRNSELNQIISTIVQIEENFNSLYHYPYTFISEELFTQEFKDKVESVCSGKVYYELIPKSLWSIPENIDLQKYEESIEILKSKGVQYASLESYHHMCRINSGHFYNLEGLKKFKYYWRFEPSTKYFCKINYDLFKFMIDNELIYGFTISLYDDPNTIENLWPTTLEFLEKNPQYVNKNAAFKFLTENQQNPKNTNGANGYSTCHFWSNFEIGDMDFYRGEAYSKWIEYLDESGGFFYERWGDAPVHSVGLGLFADKSKIWWFRDIGYWHSPYNNMPLSDQCKYDKDYPGFFAPEDVLDQNCLPNWYRFEMDDHMRELY